MVPHVLRGPRIGGDGVQVTLHGHNPRTPAARAAVGCVRGRSLGVSLTVLLCVLLGAALPVRAGRVIAPDLQRLTQDSEAIIHGLVLSTQARWVDDARGRRIRTYATVRCHQWLKGQGGNEVVVELPGGLVGEIRERVTPAVRVSRGEEVVLFLKGDPLRPAAGVASKLLVERGAAHGLLGVMPLPELVSQVDALTGRRPRQAVKPRPEPAQPQAPPLRLKPEPKAGAAAPRPDASQSATHLAAAAAKALGPVLPAAGWTTIKSETFDGAWPNDWALYGNIGTPAITWGPEDYYRRSGNYSGWAAGATHNPFTQSLPKPASGTLISRMTYGPFDLRGATDARVTFWTTYQLAVNDKLRWEVSKDGSNFYGGFQGEGNTLGTWSQVTLDLKAVPTLGNLCGHDGIYFRLQCDSDDEGAWVKGPFVDDLLIEKYVVDNMPDVAIDAFSITPRQSSVGTELTASVTVRNAGTGTLTQDFAVDFYRNRTSAPGSGDAGDHTWTVTDDLAPGETRVLTWNFTPAAYGTYHAYVAVDRANTLPEYDEANNRRGPLSYYVIQANWQAVKIEDFEGLWPNDWAVNSNFTDGTNLITWAPQTWLAVGDSKAGGGQANSVDPASTPGTMWAGGILGTMTYGPFSLVGCTDARVRFFVSYDLGADDKIRWEASINGTAFYGLNYTNGNTLPGWSEVTFDLKSVPTLGNLCGQATVYFRLVCESGSTDGGNKGPFVDDIVIERYGASLPWITSISPGSESAGTNSQVTITGTNFGTQGANSRVQFFQAAGNPKLNAAIVSWSNTAIVCTVPEDASSGPVTVRNQAGGESNNYTFVVTFGYGGIKWPGSSPTLTYRINENTADCTGEGAAVQAAFATWNAAGAAFAFAYGGTTSATNASNNGINEIFWDTTPEDPNATALNTTWFTGSTILESDIAFNDEKLWSTTGASNAQDVESIALHELGHSLQLSDLYGTVDSYNDSGKVLYGRGLIGGQKRSLTTQDINGINWIYPNTTLGIAVTPATWTIPGLQPAGGTVLTASGTRFQIQNTGNVSETLRLKVATQDSLGRWTAGSSAGAERYWLRALFCGAAETPASGDFASDDTVTTTVQAATASARFNRAGASYGVNMAVNAFAYLWFRLDLPLSVTDGASHQITVEVSCETP